MRVLRSSALKVMSPLFVGDDGETPEDCASTPTATVTHEDGTSLTALTVAAETDPGLYSSTLTSTHTANLGSLRVTWTGTVDSLVQVYVDEYEVVGAHYATVPEIRNLRGIDRSDRFPLATVRDVRDHWAERIEDACGVPFVPRYARDVQRGDGTCRLALSQVFPRTLLSVKVDSVSQTTSEFYFDGSAIVWDGGTFTAGDEVIVAYEHWHSRTPPADIRREYLKVVRQELLRDHSDLPPDAIYRAFADGEAVRYSTPDPANGRATGAISLDAVLVGYDYKVPAVG